MTEEINSMIDKLCESVEKRISQYELEKENAELKDYSQRMENQRENYYKEYLRLKQENEKQCKALEKIREYCEKQNLKADWTACDILQMIDEVLND